MLLHRLQQVVIALKITVLRLSTTSTFKVLTEPQAMQGSSFRVHPLLNRPRSLQNKLLLLFKSNHNQRDVYRTVTIAEIPADISLCDRACHYP